MTLLNYTDPIPLPAPITSGSGIQPYTDPIGDVWMAANGVNGGVYKRARDVAYCRYYRGTAFNVPATTDGLIIMDTINTDDYGLYNSTTGVWNAPVPGIYHMIAQVGTANLSVVAEIRVGIYHGVCGSGGAVNAYVRSSTSASGNSANARADVITKVATAGDGWTVGCSMISGGQQAANVTYYWTHFMAMYLGTG